MLLDLLLSKAKTPPLEHRITRYGVESKGRAGRNSTALHKLDRRLPYPPGRIFPHHAGRVEKQHSALDLASAWV